MVKEKIMEPKTEMDIVPPDEDLGSLSAFKSFSKPKWRIEADIDPELKRAGLEFLKQGIRARKVAIH